MPETVIFHLSDIHFGIEDRRALAWFAGHVSRERPDLVICTGDLTQRAKRSEYAAARAWFAALGVPVLIEPGNHDMPYYNPLERFRTPFRRYGMLEAALAGPADLPDIAIIPLRTTVSAQWRLPWSDGVIRSQALGQAVARLERLGADGRLRLVVCHHPLVARHAGGANPTIGGDAALAAIAAAGAEVILSGHVHQAFDFLREAGGRQVRLIGSGTMSERLRGHPPSYNVLRYSRVRGLAVELRDFPSGAGA